MSLKTVLETVKTFDRLEDLLSKQQNFRFIESFLLYWAKRSMHRKFW